MFWQQYELHGWMEKYNIQHEAWGPLAQHRLKEVIEHPVVKEIALKYGKEPVQIALRHHVQRGIVVIPKSIHKDRMKQFFPLNHFHLQLKLTHQENHFYFCLLLDNVPQWNVLF